MDKFSFKTNITKQIFNNKKIGSIIFGPSKTGKTTFILENIPKNQTYLLFCGFTFNSELKIKTSQLDEANYYLQKYKKMLLLDEEIKLKFEKIDNNNIKLIYDLSSSSQNILIGFLVSFIDALINKPDYYIIKNVLITLDSHIDTIILDVLIDLEASKVIIPTRLAYIPELLTEETKEKWKIFYIQPEQILDQDEQVHDPEEFISPDDKLLALVRSKNDLKYTNNLLKIACPIMLREFANKINIYRNTNITPQIADVIEAITDKYYIRFSNRYFHYNDNFQKDFINEIIKEYQVNWNVKTNFNEFINSSNISQREFYLFLSNELQNRPYYSKFFKLLYLRVFSEELLFKTAKLYNPQIETVDKSYGNRLRAYADVFREHINVENDFWREFISKMSIVSHIIHGGNNWKSLITIKNSEIIAIENTLMKLSKILQWDKNPLFNS